MHFVSRKAGNIETFFCDLWDVEIPQIRDKRSWYQIWKLLQSQYVFQWMILICESFVVFIHCIRIRILLRIISKSLMSMVARFHNVLCGTYFSGTGLPGNKVKSLVIIFNILLLGVKN